MSIRKQSGFSIIEIIIVIVVLALVGLIGYTMLNRDTVKEQSATAGDVPAATVIGSAADLDSAQKELDSINLDASNQSDLNELDSELAHF